VTGIFLSLRRSAAAALRHCGEVGIEQRGEQRERFEIRPGEVTPVGDTLQSPGAGVQAEDDSFPCLEGDSVATASGGKTTASRQRRDSLMMSLTLVSTGGRGAARLRGEGKLMGLRSGRRSSRARPGKLHHLLKPGGGGSEPAQESDYGGMHGNCPLLAFIPD
jgi:hypothetical protein